MAPSWRKRVMDNLSEQVYEMVVWPAHLLRQVDREVDCTFVHDLCAPYYHKGTAKGGRPAEEPERIFGALLVTVLYGIPFETTLVGQIGVNLAFRWFTGLGIVERVFDHSLFHVVRDRLGEAVFEAILAGIFEQCVEQGLIGHEWAFYDCTDIAATATRYTLYERAVILAGAVLRLLERPPAERRHRVPGPPSPPSPALRRCPNQELDSAEREMRIISHRQDGTDEYAGQRCADCALRAQCTTKAKGPRTVRLHPARHRHRMAIQAKAQTIEHRAAMRRRMASIEPIVGHGKVYHHWAKAPYRSVEMNRIFTLLLAIAHDVEKLVRYAAVERQRRSLAC